MLKWLLLLSVVNYISAQKRCCLPDQFEGAIGDTSGFVVDGKPGSSSGYTLVSFDYPTKRVAEYINMTTNGHPYIQKLILDYNEDVVYTIDEKQRTCKVTKPAPSLQRCIPDEAKEVGSFYLGAGKNTLKVRSFTFVDKSRKIGATATCSFTMDCIPVGEIAHGTANGVPFMLSMSWVDVTRGIKDPSVFALPKYCEHQEAVEMEQAFIAFMAFHSKKPGFN